MKKNFTLIIIGLSLLLGGLIYFTFTKNTNASTSAKSASEITTKIKKKERSGKKKMAKIRQSIELELLKTQDPTTGKVPSERLVDAERFMLQKMASPFRTEIAGVNWTERGPDNVGGRTRAILFDANDVTHKKVWAGGASGGLWHTTDITANPVSWVKQDDFFGNLAVTAIVQNPSDATEMYFSTGEGFTGAVHGKGIWKSTNSGASWTAMGGTSETFTKITELVITSAGTLLASVEGAFCNSSEGGVWRYPVGGPWTKIHNGSGGTGGCAGTGGNTGASDIVVAANGHIYAGLGPDHDDGIYRSTNDGVTWTKIFTSNAPEERIEMASAPSNPNVLYALIEGDDYKISRIIKSTNAAGGSPVFSDLTLPNWCDQGSASTDFTRGQAFYDLAIAVDPNAANTVFIGGIDLLKSTNGGTNWTQITQWAGGTNCGAIAGVHADHHNLTFQPGSSTVLINGSDGGIHYTADATAAAPAFAPKNNGYNITQYYACAMHPTDVNYFLAGAQDNGSQKYTTPGMNSTTSASGGDGAFCHIDQDNGNNQITAYTYNSYYISTNGGTSFENIVLGGANKGKFINPTELDDANDDFYTSDANGHYSVITNVFSPSRQYVKIPLGIAGIGQVSALKIDRCATNNTLWLGTDKGRLIKVVNANNHGTKVVTNYSTKPGMPSLGSNIQSIDIDPTNSDHIIFCLSNYGVTSIFETTDGGENWTAVEGNLPDMPVRWVMFNPADSDQAYIATELGVWSTQDLDGASTDWDPTNTGLANVRVDMLQHRMQDNMIAAATHGRGLYTAPVTGPVYASFNGSGTSVSEAHVVDGCASYKTVNIPVKVNTAGNVTVNITADAASTATADDYTLQTSSLTFTGGGATSQNVELRIVDDGITEGNETIILTLTVVSGGQKGEVFRHTVTISDDDTDPNGALPITNGQLGLGASELSNYPLQGNYEDARTQMFFLASELTAQGFTAGEITEVAYNVYEKNSSAPYNSFTIKMKNTATASATGTMETGATTAYTGAFTPVLGWNAITMTTPFYWDGTSNLMIETCFDNGGYTDTDLVNATNTASPMLQYLRNDGVSGCTLSGAMTTQAKRTNTKLKIRKTVNVESAINKSKMANVGTGETVHFYSDGGSIMATITHISGTAPGCVTVTVDQAGTGNPVYPNLNNIKGSEKNYTVTAANPTSTYDLTLYYTDAELAIWAGDKMSLNMVKSSSSNGISDPAATKANSIVYAATATTFGSSNHIAYKGQFTSFSSFGLSDAPVGVLPVELLSFNGKLVNNYVQLDWTTVSEINNSGFEVERSLDGRDFTKIAFVEGNGTSTDIHDYDLKDRELIGTIQYYRLKQIDLDDTYTYSNVVAVEIGKGKTFLAVSPNPFSNTLNISLNPTFSGKFDAELLSTNGKRVWNKSMNGSSNVSISIEENLPTGTYILRLKNEAGEMETFKLFHN